MSEIAKERYISVDEFNQLREKDDRILEYADGVVYALSSPSTKHQEISGRMHVALFQFVSKKGCKVFHAPYDIELSHESVPENKTVVPDLTVICDVQGILEKKYVGVPTLIVEILSPYNEMHDLWRKLGWYAEYGVKEYWIINPRANTVTIHGLNENMEYEQVDVLKERGMAKSLILEGFQVDIEDIFAP